MPTFKVCILANNEAGTWASWQAKMAAIKAFYASVCNLDITLTPTTLTPQFAPYEPASGSSSVYRVDEGWYEANVSPLADAADIVMFVVPPTDHPNVVTLMGLDFYQQGKTGELTVFADETSHTYVGEADQGETAVVYAQHELSHQFYGLLAKTDNTHLYFYAGTPAKVLADFDFNEQELTWYQQAVQDLEQELGLLKARQVPPIGDPAPSEPQNSAPQSNATPETTQTSSSGPSVTGLATFIKNSIEGWAMPGQTINGVSYPNGTISYQCNNPDNAKYASQQYATPRTFVINGVNETFADFDTYEHGWQYMLDCLTAVRNGTDAVYNAAAQKLGLSNSGDLTINDFFVIRDPVSDANNPGAVAASVAKEFNVPLTFQMKQFSLT
jgi:hypothetical protein